MMSNVNAKELRKMYCKKKESKLNNKEQRSTIELYKSIGLWKGGN